MSRSVRIEKRVGWGVGADWIGLVLFVFFALSVIAPDRVHAENPASIKKISLKRDPFRKPRLFADIQSSFRPALDLSRVERGQFVTRYESGVKSVYTLNPALQRGMERFLKKNRVPYGVFVAMDPNTGKILAFVEHSAKDPYAQRLALRATYPAASIFKVITASALLEDKQVYPDTRVMDLGRSRSVQTTFEKAFAASDNEAFGAMALRYLNVATLIKYAVRFQFNQRIPFDLPVDVSRIQVKPHRGARDLAGLAAGFGDVGLSPLHAALIGSAIANEGRMVRPCLIDHVVDPSGKRIFECVPRLMARAVSETTAAQLMRMMEGTVTHGTGRRAFRSARVDPALRSVAIGGKTGSLTGESPPGHVTWFVGMAPLDNPKVVVSAMVINSLSGRWKVRAANVAKEGFSEYFASKQPVRLARR